MLANTRPHSTSQAAYRALSPSRTTSGSKRTAATLFHNLGGLEHARGRFAAGEPHARRSVEIRARLRGADHPDTAADVSALAALLDGQGRYDDAEQLYLRALSVFERAYGPEHYELAVNLNNLAALSTLPGGRRNRRVYIALSAVKDLSGPTS